MIKKCSEGAFVLWVQCAKDGFNFDIINVYYPHKGMHKAKNPSIRQAVEDYLFHIFNLRPHSNVFVLGDFNRSTQFKPLFNQFGLVSVFGQSSTHGVTHGTLDEMYTNCHVEGHELQEYMLNTRDHVAMIAKFKPRYPDNGVSIGINERVEQSGMQLKKILNYPATLLHLCNNIDDFMLKSTREMIPQNILMFNAPVKVKEDDRGYFWIELKKQKLKM